MCRARFLYSPDTRMMTPRISIQSKELSSRLPFQQIPLRLHILRLKIHFSIFKPQSVYVPITIQRHIALYRRLVRVNHDSIEGSINLLRNLTEYDKISNFSFETECIVGRRTGQPLDERPFGLQSFGSLFGTFLVVDSMIGGDVGVDSGNRWVGDSGSSHGVVSMGRNEQEAEEKSSIDEDNVISSATKPNNDQHAESR